MLATLRPTFRGSRSVRIGNGQQLNVASYLAVVKLSGLRKSVLALDMRDGGPILGMRFLPNRVATFEMRTSGKVKIEPNKGSD